MAFLGMSRTFLATTLPSIRFFFNLSLVEAGTLIAFLQIGFLIAVFVGGPLSDLFKKSSILIAGCVIMGITLIIFGSSKWFWISLMAAGLIGVGGGFIESGSNPLIVQLYPGRESMVMNLHHFFFALGSLLGPLIVGTMLAKSISWQLAYIGFGLLVIALFPIFISKRIPYQKVKEGFELKVIGSLLKERIFLILFFTAALNIGVQSGISYWMVTFLEEVKELSIFWASASLSIFFSSLALGRLFASYLTTRLREPTYLLGLFSLLSISILISILSPGKWAIISFGLCGFSHSGVFPCLLGMAGKLYSKNVGTALGMIATGGGLGAMSIPWLMSFVSQLTNLIGGYLFLEIFVLTCLYLMAINFRTLGMAIQKSSLKTRRP